MKAVENFPDKSLYDFVTFKLRPPSDNLGINLCQLQSFSGHTARLLWTYVCCWTHPIVETMGPGPKRSELSGPSKVLSGVIQYFLSHLIWFQQSLDDGNFHNNDGNVTCYITVFNWWKVVTQLFPFVTFCLIQIWFQPHLSQGSRNGENWQISLIFPKSFIYGI